MENKPLLHRRIFTCIYCRRRPQSMPSSGRDLVSLEILRAGRSKLSCQGTEIRSYLVLRVRKVHRHQHKRRNTIRYWQVSVAPQGTEQWVNGLIQTSASFIAHAQEGILSHRTFTYCSLSRMSLYHKLMSATSRKECEEETSSVNPCN